MSTPLHIDDLRALANTGVRLKYVFFWRDTPRVPGTLDSACFSQWYPSPFDLDGCHYPTAEHYMMSEKARLFGDDEVRARVLAAPHPGAAKKAGRDVRGFVESTWNEKRFDIVVRGNIAKFEQHPDLRDYLTHTGERILVEASPRDLIWGIGLAADDPRVEEPAAWPGLNLLGFALMAVRDQLRSKPPSAAPGR